MSLSKETRQKLQEQIDALKKRLHLMRTLQRMLDQGKEET